MYSILFLGLQEGRTHIGSEEGGDCDIMLSGLNVEKHHCTIELCNGVATLLPAPQAQCWVNTVPVDKPTKLSQGKLHVLFYQPLLLCRLFLFH